jgi:hypothetical protein
MPPPFRIATTSAIERAALAAGIVPTQPFDC